MATIVGDSGDNVLNGVNGQDNIIYGDTDGTADPSTLLGNDTITGGSNATNLIFGDAETLMGHATTGGDDTLIGGANSTNTLVGDSNDDLGAPFGGNDTLTGGTNSTNTLIGDIVNAGAGALGGNDTLIGGKGGTNNLVGDFADVGGSADGGNDRLVSAANTTDNMWGDFQSVDHPGMNIGGADTFAFGRHNGEDVIYDFNAQQGDKIEIDTTHVPAKFPTSFADLNIQEVNGNSVIQFDPHDSVTVVGVTGLTADDFHFVA
jgi:hypothetical protein